MTKPENEMRRIAIEDMEYAYKLAINIWESFRNKSILITGGTGFFGQWILECFIYVNRKIDLNTSITVLSRNPELFLESHPWYSGLQQIHFIKGDIINFELQGKQFDYIIHAATDADAQLNQSEPLLMFDTIVTGTRKMLDFARQQPLKGFLLTSSGAVYGRQPENITHVLEDMQFVVNCNSPLSAYAEGKRVAELLCSVYSQQYEVPVKIARCFAFVGPHLPLNKHFAIGNFLLNALNNKDIIIKGDGTPYRSYLYAADLVVWLLTILIKGNVNDPVNVGSDEDFTIAEIAAKVAGLNKKISVQVLGVPDLSKPVERYVPDTSKAALLQLTTRIPIDIAIQKTFNYYA